MKGSGWDKSVSAEGMMQQSLNLFADDKLKLCRFTFS